MTSSSCFCIIPGQNSSCLIFRPIELKFRTGVNSEALISNSSQKSTVCFFVPCCGKLNRHDSCILMNYLSSAFNTIFVITQTYDLPLKVVNVKGHLWHSCCGVFVFTFA